jgi:beta-lactamase class A
MPYQYRNPRHYRYTPEPMQRRRRSRRSFAPIAGAIVIGIVALGYVGVQIIQSKAAADASAKKLQAQSAVAQQAGASIRNLIAADDSDTIGVAIENVKTGAVTTYGSTGQFEAASTEKVLSAITYYHLVEKGVLSLDDTVGPYPASYQLQQMINQSNNDSWNAINDAVGGNDELQAYARSIGLQYNVDGNLMSTKDMAVLLTKLYTGELLNADHTKTLLSYMQHTNDETLIPSVLPSGLTIYHKYGELVDGATNVLHDAAIVTDGSNAYAIVIYSDGKTGVDARTKKITQIAQAALTVCGW